MPQPAPPVPQIPAGWSPVQADLDLWVTNSFSFLAQPANARFQLGGGQALTGNALNIVHFDTVLEDPYSGWSATATANQAAWSWLCPAGCGGWYEVTMAGFAASQGSGTTNQLLTALILNGSLWQYASDDWAVASAPSGSSGTVQVPLLPGDYVQAAILPTASVSTGTTASELPSMELAWVSS
jgi:hypothetical protein